MANQDKSDTLKHTKPDFPIEVVVRNLDTGQIVNKSTGNYAKGTFREWLGKMSVWALMSNHAVSTTPLGDYTGQKLPKYRKRPAKGEAEGGAS